MSTQTLIKPTHPLTGRTVLIFGLATSLLLSAFILLSFSPKIHAITPPDNCFNFNSGTGTITDYYEHEANDSSNPACPKAVDIPATIGAVPVTAVGGSAFTYMGLTSVTIPNSVTILGLGAFQGNQLTQVTIPSSVTSIGGYAFAGNQFNAVVFQGPVTTFGTEIFRNSTLLASITYNGTEYTPQLPINDACFEMTGNTLAKYLIADMNLIKDNGIGCLSRQVDIPATIGIVPVTAVGHNAFTYMGLTSVTIPSSVTSIGDYAFAGNQLTTITVEGDNLATIGIGVLRDGNPINTVTYNGVTYTSADSTPSQCFTYTDGTNTVLTGYRLFDLEVVRDQGILCGWGAITIPNSVTVIEDGAFYAGHITAITLPSGLTTIGNYAFYANQLTTVHIPSSVTSIGNTAFAVQNPYGGDIEGGFLHPDYFIWSDDPQIVQKAYDVIWYAQLYTEDPSNPAGLQDGILNEAWWWAMDANDNGHVNDSLGGHLINPAQATITYANSHGNQVQASQVFTGILSDNTPLTNYLASQGPALPAIDDPSSLTPEEQDELDEALSAYYRIGDTFTYTGPIIQGITPTPASYSFVLGASTSDNTKTFTYPGLASSDDPDELAETGLAQTAGIVLVAMALSFVSIRIHTQRTKHYTHQSRV